MSYHVWIGVDPGQSGGVGIIRELGGPAAFKMPETEGDVYGLLQSVKNYGIHISAVIERAHSMPKQGVASSFKFGRNFGGLLMALTASGIPFTEVAPQSWQKALGCLSKGDKNVTKRRAQQLFPDIKITHATADAMLLAEFCRRTKGAGR